MGAFVFYALMVGGGVATISEVWGELQRAAGAAERLVDLINARSLIADPGTQETAASAKSGTFSQRSRETCRPVSGNRTEKGVGAPGTVAVHWPPWIRPNGLQVRSP